MQLWGLANLECIEQARRLRIRAGGGVACSLEPKICRAVHQAVISGSAFMLQSGDRLVSFLGNYILCS